MKKVEAFIRHEAFEPIRMELLSLGFPSLTIMEAKGSGRQKERCQRYRGAELTNSLRPKIKLGCGAARAINVRGTVELECVVAGRDVAKCVDTVLKHAWSVDE